MTNLSVKLYPDTLRSIDSASFTGSYQAIGTALTQSTRIVKFTNNSNVLVLVSWDGTNNHEALPPGSFLLLDVSTNKENGNILEIPVGTQFFVSGSSGTGLVYLSTYYAR